MIQHIIQDMTPFSLITRSSCSMIELLLRFLTGKELSEIRCQNRSACHIYTLRRETECELLNAGLEKVLLLP